MSEARKAKDGKSDVEAEFVALEEIIKALIPLDAAARVRILRYVRDRYGLYLDRD
jgi:hypothetical protein